MSNTQTALTIRDDMSLSQLGDVLVKSGYFKDAAQAAQAVVKVMAGRELGFGPIASMTGFHIIQGKISMSANLMAAAVKRSGRYDFRVLTIGDKACELEFYEIVNGKRESLGKSPFTIEDGKRAGTQNLDKFPRNMLFSRAMSNGVKWYCPDVTGGPVYTPEELGATVNEDGEIIDAQPVKAGPISTPGGIVSAPVVSAPPIVGTLTIERINAAYAAADWLVAHPVVDSASLSDEMRAHGDATGWVRPDDVHTRKDARASFARYIETIIIASGKTEAAQ